MQGQRNIENCSVFKKIIFNYLISFEWQIFANLQIRNAAFSAKVN